MRNAKKSALTNWGNSGSSRYLLSATGASPISPKLNFYPTPKAATGASTSLAMWESSRRTDACSTWGVRIFA
jgi:hypothetical protein